MSSIEPRRIPGGASSFDPLDRQERRRRQGLPTVSTCVGPVGLAVASWRHWCTAAGRAAVIVENPAAEQWLAGFAAGFNEQDLLAGARQRLAARLRRPIEDFEGKSSYELQLLFARLDRAGRCKAGHAIRDLREWQ